MRSFRLCIIGTLFSLIGMNLSVSAQDFILERLGSQINTLPYHEISPSVSTDGQTLYFTRVGSPDFCASLVEQGTDLSDSLSSEGYYKKLQDIYGQLAGVPVANPIRSGFNQDVWLAHSVHGLFDALEHPGAPLNNALPNSISSLTPHPNEMIVINQFTEGGGMRKGFSSIRQRFDGSWAAPKAIEIDDYHNSGPDVNIAMGADGRVMIMALERPDGYGQSDLYVSFKNDKGQWSSPQNLGPSVNTPGRETCPFIAPDLTTLFYASDRNTGDMDIFVQERIGDNWLDWLAPQRFSSPVNSNRNDSHPHFNEASGHLYFTSDRDGSSDIFRIQIKPATKEFRIIKGIVLDRQKMTPLAARVVVHAPAQKSYRHIPTADDGFFQIRIPDGQGQVEIAVEKEGYLGESKVIILAEHGEQIHLSLYLEPIAEEKPEVLLVSRTPIPESTKKSVQTPSLAVGDRIELKAIYFQRSTAFVLKKSYPALDQLARKLKNQPDLYIQIEGHTDNQGEFGALRKLSKERAESIKDYLVYKHQINPVRLKTIGYGATKAINDNSTEERRRKNRRVEIRIIHNGTVGADLKSTSKRRDRATHKTGSK